MSSQDDAGNQASMPSRDPALIEVARAGSESCVSRLLQQGAEINERGLQGDTVLHAGIDHGASICIANDAGLSALQLACLRDAPQVLGSLLGSDEAQAAGQAGPEGRAAVGDEALAAMFAAVASGSAACLTQLARFAPAAERYRAHAGAVASGCIGPLQTTLLQDRQRALLDPDALGRGRELRSLCFLQQTASLPSHMAAALGHTECLALLLSADPLAASDANLEGWQPLLYAASAGHVGCIELLLQHGANLEHHNKQGRTALFLAAISGEPRALAEVIRAGAQLNVQESARGYTALMAAATRAAMLDAQGAPEAERFLECVALLVAAGADVSVCSKSGATALHAAAEHGSCTCLALLLRGAGADVDGPKEQGRSPIGAAAAGNHAQCVLYLIERGAVVAPGLADSVMRCLAAAPLGLWEMLARLSRHHVQPLTSSREFYSLPLPDTPPTLDGERMLQPSVLSALLEVAVEGVSNLMYNVLPSSLPHLSRRPSHLFKLVRRGWPSSPELQAVLSSDASMARALYLWHSAPPLLQYASVISRCAMVPPEDKEKLAGRVGHLLAAYHQLAALCRHAGLAFPSGTRLPTAAASCVQLPLDATSGADPQPQQTLQEQEVTATLAAHGDTVARLVAQAGEGAALAGWSFLLEYPQAAPLPVKQRLLQSMVGALERRRQDQLDVVTGRQAVLQSLCTAVDERRGGASPIGVALWHGIKVTFRGEHGVGDGVRREWFGLLAAELCNPDAGLFETHNEGASYQPAPHAHVHCDEGAGAGHLEKFELVGSMLGLALLQGCTVPGFNLGPHVWRLLLGAATGGENAAASLPPAPSFEDLLAADPQLAQGLSGLRQLQRGVGELGLHFQTHTALGTTVDLVPGGGDVAVTQDNLEQYIQALSHHKLVESIHQEAAAIGRGLRSVVTRSVAETMARCLAPAELNTLLAGLPRICSADWEAHASYTHCTPSTPAVAWFWQFVRELPQPHLAALLCFVTGSRSLPAGSFAGLRGFNGAAHPFTLVLVASEGDDRLPRASTCFNTLYLPAYSCPEVLRRRLTLAISGEQAFDEGVITR